MTVFLSSGTQKALDTVVFQGNYLPPGVGAAGRRQDRPAKLHILKLMATLSDVTCSECLYPKKRFHTAGGPDFYSEG